MHTSTLDTLLLALVVVQLQRTLPGLRTLRELAPLFRALADKLGVKVAPAAPAPAVDRALDAAERKLVDAASEKLAG